MKKTHLDQEKSQENPLVDPLDLQEVLSNQQVTKLEDEQRAKVEGVLESSESNNLTIQELEVLEVLKATNNKAKFLFTCPRHILNLISSEECEFTQEEQELLHLLLSGQEVDFDKHSVYSLNKKLKHFELDLDSDRRIVVFKKRKYANGNVFYDGLLKKWSHNSLYTLLFEDRFRDNFTEQELKLLYLIVKKGADYDSNYETIIGINAKLTHYGRLSRGRNGNIIQVGVRDNQHLVSLDKDITEKDKKIANKLQKKSKGIKGEGLDSFIERVYNNPNTAIKIPRGVKIDEIKEGMELDRVIFFHEGQVMFKPDFINNYLLSGSKLQLNPSRLSSRIQGDMLERLLRFGSLNTEDFLGCFPNYIKPNDFSYFSRNKSVLYGKLTDYKKNPVTDSFQVYKSRKSNGEFTLEPTAEFLTQHFLKLFSYPKSILNFISIQTADFTREEENLLFSLFTQKTPQFKLDACPSEIIQSINGKLKGGFVLCENTEGYLVLDRIEGMIKTKILTNTPLTAQEFQVFSNNKTSLLFLLDLIMFKELQVQADEDVHIKRESYSWLSGQTNLNWNLRAAKSKSHKSLIRYFEEFDSLSAFIKDQVTGEKLSTNLDCAIELLNMISIESSSLSEVRALIESFEEEITCIRQSKEKIRNILQLQSQIQKAVAVLELSKGALSEIEIDEVSEKVQALYTSLKATDANLSSDINEEQ